MAADTPTAAPHSDPRQHTQSPGMGNWIRLIALGIIWGGSFMAVELALRDVGPLSIAAARVTLGAILLTALTYAFGQRLPRPGRVWLYVLGLGVFSNALPFSLLSWGQQYVPSAFAGVSMAVVPLFVLPLAFLMVPGETLHRRKVIGFLIGFLGVALLIGIGDIGAALAGGTLLAKLACIAATLSYAVGAIITRLSPLVPHMAFSAAGLIVASIFTLPAALLLEGAPGPVGPTALTALIYLAIMPTAVATLLLVSVIQSAGPSFLSLVNYQVPIWSIIFGLVFLSETLPPNFMVAVALILVGVLISQSRRRRQAQAA